MLRELPAGVAPGMRSGLKGCGPPVGAALGMRFRAPSGTSGRAWLVRTIPARAQQAAAAIGPLLLSGLGVLPALGWGNPAAELPLGSCANAIGLAAMGCLASRPAARRRLEPGAPFGAARPVIASERAPRPSASGTATATANPTATASPNANTNAVAIASPTASPTRPSINASQPASATAPRDEIGRAHV